MKIIQFILSILIALCAIGMIYGAITIYSPMKSMNIGFTVLLFVGSLVLTRLTYKEL